MTQNTSDTEYKVIVERLAFAAIDEQKRKRRWRTFFVILTFIYFTPLFLLSVDMSLSGIVSKDKDGKKHTAKISMTGIIMSETPSGAESIIKGLKSAYKDTNTVGVILDINSPGGSPVQSAYIYDEIKRLRDAHPDIPFYAVVEDVAASGGYFVASAADKIYVNKSSMVGSIGVRMDNFGAVDLMQKLGVERRLMTAGKHKGMLDPFLPVDEVQSIHVQTMLNDVHRHFIESVKQGRGDRLKDVPDVFSGLIWSGEKARELGLVDDYGTIDSVARDVINAEDVKDFTVKEMLLERLADRIGATFSNSIGAMLGLNPGIIMK